jgi:hypothetical protein
MDCFWPESKVIINQAIFPAAPETFVQVANTKAGGDIFSLLVQVSRIMFN